MRALNPSLVLTGLIAASAPAAAHAQPVVSRPVVQPLPAQDTQRLNRALVALAKRPRNMDALIEAGEAALAVDDLDAALGFFGRAREVDGEDARAYLGLARVYLRAGRAAVALPLFDEAREAGAGLRALRSDRALALDMVGDHGAAQGAYARLLEISPSDHEARRRLALSYAISGRQAEFEATLRPLIERRDFAAFRARAFGLAILGQQQRAAAITEAVMPRELAGKITPYLEFMPRLTGPQQSAAANLGIFPRAAQIGRDDPEVAAYRAARSSPDGGGDGGASAAGGPAAMREASADSPLEPVGEPLGPPPSAVTGMPQGTEAAPEATDPATGSAASPSESQPDPEPATLADAFGDMLAAPPPGDAGAAPAQEGAVDIAAIEVPREAAPDAAQSEPDHPARVWVQLATGRELEALGFDWRRLSRKAPDLLAGFAPHSVPWGQANRLLAGPIETRAKAQDLVNALREKGLDTFVYASPEGLEIQTLELP